MPYHSISNALHHNAAPHDKTFTKHLMMQGFMALAILFCTFWGLSAQAQVTYSLNQDTTITFDSGEINESQGFIHVFNARLIYQGETILTAVELKAQMRSSLDAETQIIENLFARRIRLLDPDDKADITIQSITGKNLVLQNATITAAASDAEIVRFMTSESPASIEIKNITGILPEDGIQIDIKEIVANGAQNISDDATAAQISQQLAIKDFILSAYGNSREAQEFSALLDELRRDEIRLNLDGLSTLAFDDGQFETGLAFTLNVANLSDIAFSITGQAGKSVLAFADALATLEDNPENETEILGLLMANTGDIELTSAQLVLHDRGALSLVDTNQANGFIQNMLQDTSSQLSQVASQPIASFLEQGGKLEITIAPPRPANLVQLVSVFFAPDAAVFMLGLGVNHLP